MDNFYKTRKGININKSEIAATADINHRKIFQGQGKEDKNEYDFMIVLKCGEKFFLESDYYLEDIEKIKEELPCFKELY